MLITVGEIFQSIMAGIAFLANIVFIIVVFLACINKVTLFYDLVNIPYNKDPYRRSTFDSFFRLIMLTLTIVCKALSGRFCKYGLFGEMFSAVEIITLFAIFGQVFILIKSTREFEKRRKELNEKMQRDIEQSKQEIRESLNQHAIALEIEIDPEEFFEKMQDPEDFKKWLKEHHLQLSEEDRMMMSPEEEEALVKMGFLPSREEVALAKEEATEKSKDEASKEE